MAWVRWSLPAAGAAALLTFFAAVLLTPDPANTPQSGLAGWPRLLVYAVAGALLAVTAPPVCLRPIRMARFPLRGYGLVALGAAAALLVAIVNAFRLRTAIADPLGPPLWVASMLVLLAYTWFPLARSIGWRGLWPASEKVARHRWVALLLLVVIIAVAAGVRLPDLGDVPKGINPDEGDRASTSIDLLHGQGPVAWFDSGWFFINMVYFRVLAASLAVFGPGVAGGRMLSALVGIAFVAVIAWIGWRNFSPRVGLTVAAFAACMQITIQHSRLITEAGPTALLWAISVGSFLEGARTGRMWAWALAGLTGGLSLYFYPSARLWAIGAVFTVLVMLAHIRSRRLLPGIGLAAVASVVAVLPFVVHLSVHVDELSGRYAQTAVLDPNNQVRLAYLNPPEPVLQLLTLQVERTIGMFDRYPDGGGFLPTGHPIFGPPLAQLALVGAFYLLIRGWRDVRLAVLSVWFWVGLSGVALTVETPDYLRSMGMLPSLPFVLVIPLLDVVDRCLTLAPSTQRAFLNGAAPAALAVFLLAPEVGGYFSTFRVLPDGWAPETHEGQVIAAMGTAGPVYSLEMNEHMVSSGWVRLLAPSTERGRVPNPGRELPLITPIGALPDSNISRPEYFPVPGQAVSVIMSPDPNQEPYIPLLQQLYPGAVLGDGGGDQRHSIEVPAAAATDTQGVTVVDSSGAQRRVDHFGDVPADSSGTLTWRAGVRITSVGRYRFNTDGPVSSVMVDGVQVPQNQEVDAVPGVHLVEVRAANQFTMTVNGQPLSPRQTYRLMDAPWGLVAHVGRPGGTWLDAMVAMAFFEPELSFVAPPNSITWSGSLIAPADGMYRMAFAAEDPMHLRIDGQPADVVTASPDGWRNVGSGSPVRLSAGPHRVEVSLEVTHGGRELARWNWVPPAPSGELDDAAPWSVVPPSVLRPDAAITVVGTAALAPARAR